MTLYQSLGKNAIFRTCSTITICVWRTLLYFSLRAVQNFTATFEFLCYLHGLHLAHARHSQTKRGGGGKKREKMKKKKKKTKALGRGRGRGAAGDAPGGVRRRVRQVAPRLPVTCPSSSRKREPPTPYYLTTLRLPLVDERALFVILPFFVFHFFFLLHFFHFPALCTFIAHLPFVLFSTLSLPFFSSL